MGDNETAVLSDIQRFCLHDGPGIRTTLFFKGCPLRCAWCQNPETQNAAPEMAFFEERCVRCFTCDAVCPEDAILELDHRRVDFSRCTACGICAEQCPSRALRHLGGIWNARDLGREALRDLDFFVDSGGGVTFSGGEPMRQVSFLRRLLPLLKEHDVHLTMETCGHFPTEEALSLADLIDCWYFDLKLVNSEQHLRYTGQRNELILENFRRMSDRGLEIQARMPLIPGINDTRDNLVGTANFLKENNHESVHCLPYHRLGESKRIRIGRAKERFRPATQGGEYLARAKAILEEEGIEPIIYD